MTASPRVVLGVDLGGSKTVALLADEAACPLGRGQSEGANWLADPRAAAEALQAAIERALAAAGVGRSSVVAACIGAAGADRATVAGQVVQAAHGCLPSVAVQVVPDAALGLAAAGLEVGVVVVAGTGSIAWGRNRAGQTARAGGWGYLLGDEGSAYDVGRQVLAAALAARDGQGEETLLAPLLVHHCSLEQIEDVVEWVYASVQPRLAIAALAPLVGQAAASGDAVARGIVARAGLALGRVAGTVIRRLDMVGEVALVPIGGLFALGEPLVSAMVEEARHNTEVVLHWPEDEPAVGAARLAGRVL